MINAGNEIESAPSKVPTVDPKETATQIIVDTCSDLWDDSDGECNILYSPFVAISIIVQTYSSSFCLID